MAKSKRLAQVGSRCVACGCCEGVCPKGAIQVWRGTVARVDEEKCVGCGKCEKVCPAAVITLVNREAAT